MYAQFQQAYGPSLWRNKLSEYLNDREVAYRRVGENFDFLFWDDIDVYEDFHRGVHQTQAQATKILHLIILTTSTGHCWMGIFFLERRMRMIHANLSLWHWEKNIIHFFGRQIMIIHTLEDLLQLTNSRKLLEIRVSLLTIGLEEIIRFFTKMIITLTKQFGVLSSNNWAPTSYIGLIKDNFSENIQARKTGPFDTKV